jgi:hypothetical protein
MTESPARFEVDAVSAMVDELKLTRWAGDSCRSEHHMTDKESRWDQRHTVPRGSGSDVFPPPNRCGRTGERP